MASTVSNLDINVMANITLEALITRLDPLKAFAMGFESNVSKNDSVKVIVEGVTKDAAAFNASSNNYETSDDDSSDGVDVTLDQHIKKTAFVEEWDISKIDPNVKLRGLAKSCAYELILNSYNTLTAANYTNTEEVVGAASTFDLDAVVDLETVADNADFEGDNRYLLVANSYLANLKKDGLITAVKNREGDYSKVWSNIEGIVDFNIHGSAVINNITGTASTENLVGLITDGTAMGIALGIPPVANTGDYEVANVIDEESKIGIQLRRHVQRSTGRVYLNAVMLYGRAVIRTGSLTRLVSA